MEIVTLEKTIPRLLTNEAQPHMSCWVEIDAAAFDHNVNQYKKLVSPALFAPVIKSNAYGHGIELIAQLCQKHEGVDRICVVSLREAVLLRTIGVQKPIIVLSIIDDAPEKAAMLDIALPLYDSHTAQVLNSFGKQYGKRIAVHIKIDTGLSRLGILAHRAHEFVLAVAQLPYIFIEGIFTHYADAESAQQPCTRNQLNIFNTVLQDLNACGIEIPLEHTTCSAAITAQHATHRTLARAGIGLYGLWPSAENKQLTQHAHSLFSLKPVLSWKTRIIQIKEVPTGSHVGYDCSHVTARATRIATLPVGYWDGYDRHLSNNSCVIINGNQAPVIGRVAMNLMMVDITEIPATLDDEVILLGNYPGVTAQELANRCGTIHYEMVTRINPLLPRIIR